MRNLVVLVLVTGSTIALAQPEPPPAETPPPDPKAACKEQRHDLSERASHTDDLHERARILRSMPDCEHPETTVVASVVAPTAAVVAPTTTGTVTGFAFEVHLETAQVLIATNSALPTAQAGVFLGYRAAGYTIGAGIDVTRFGQSSDAGGTSSGQTTTSILIMPGVRVPFAHSDDGRTELLGVLDLGYGWISHSTDGTGSSSSTPSISHIRGQAGIGLRYWISPAFAVGGTAGLRYDWLNQTMDAVAGGSASSQSQTALALFSSLQLTGVF